MPAWGRWSGGHPSLEHHKAAEEAPGANVLHSPAADSPLQQSTFLAKLRR